MSTISSPLSLKWEDSSAGPTACRPPYGGKLQDIQLEIRGQQGRGRTSPGGRGLSRAKEDMGGPVRGHGGHGRTLEKSEDAQRTPTGSEDEKRTHFFLERTSGAPCEGSLFCCSVVCWAELSSGLGRGPDARDLSCK